MDARCAESGEKAEKNRVKPLRSLVPWRRPWYFRIMTPSCESLPSDPALLTELALALRAENESLRTTISTLKALIFGARSEKFSTIAAEQLALALGEGNGDAPSDPSDLDASAKASKTPRKKAVRNIGKLPEHLPRSERVIEPATTQCPCCNGKMHRIGEDVSETLDRVPATLRVLRTIPNEQRLPSLRERRHAGSGARAADRGRHGLDRARRADRRRQIRLAVDALPADADPRGPGRRPRPSNAGALDEGTGADARGPRRVAACDDASLSAPFLRRDADAGARTAPCKDLSILGACDGRSGLVLDRPRPPSPMFRRQPRQKEIAAQLSGFEGILQVDGYAAYKALVKDEAPRAASRSPSASRMRAATSSVCSRRRARPSPRRSSEDRGGLRDQEANRRKTEELRKAVRQAETKPLMEGLHARLLAVREGLSQIAPLTKAINYMLAHWSGLTRFLDDGRIEPDTNIVERPIRFIAIGKKNSLFCGDEGGGLYLGDLVDPASDGASQRGRSRSLARRRLGARGLLQNDQ